MQESLKELRTVLAEAPPEDIGAAFDELTIYGQVHLADLLKDAHLSQTFWCQPDPGMVAGELREVRRRFNDLRARQVRHRFRYPSRCMRHGNQLRTRGTGACG